MDKEGRKIVERRAQVWKRWTIGGLISQELGRQVSTRQQSQERQQYSESDFLADKCHSREGAQGH